jgi:hypothetical protein
LKQMKFIWWLGSVTSTANTKSKSNLDATPVYLGWDMAALCFKEIPWEFWLPASLNFGSITLACDFGHIF